LRRLLASLRMTKATMESYLTPADMHNKESSCRKEGRLWVGLLLNRADGEGQGQDPGRGTEPSGRWHTLLNMGHQLQGSAAVSRRTLADPIGKSDQAFVGAWRLRGMQVPKGDCCRLVCAQDKLVAWLAVSGRAHPANVRLMELHGG